MSKFAKKLLMASAIISSIGVATSLVLTSCASTPTSCNTNK